MYFPVANIEVSPLVPPLVAFVISFFTSMGGVSGAIVRIKYLPDPRNFKLFAGLVLLYMVYGRQIIKRSGLAKKDGHPHDRGAVSPAGQKQPLAAGSEAASCEVSDQTGLDRQEQATQLA